MEESTSELVRLLQVSINDTSNETDINSTTSTNDLADFDCVFGTELSKSKGYQSLVYILYGAIFFIAIIGNGLVCLIVKSTPRMRTVTNYFIVNLAIGDLLCTLFCVPFTSVSTHLLQYWPFEMFMCVIVNYVQVISVLVCAYTLLAISLDRYVAIMWPLKPRLSKKYALIIICMIWTFALATALPTPITSTLVQPNDKYKNCEKYICMEVWDDPEDSTYYTVTLLILQLGIPLSVLVFTYMRIAFVVWSKQIPGEAENSRDQRMARSKRKMVKMMIMVVIAFTVCWLPINIYLMLMYYSQEISPTVWFIVHWLAMSHSCYNPIIYCYMNARFRSGFISMLSRLPCLRKLLPNDIQNSYPRSSTGFALTGIEASENTVLHRVNTCTTYVSVRHHQQQRTTTLQCNAYTCAVPPARAASYRCHTSGAGNNGTTCMRRNNATTTTSKMTHAKMHNCFDENQI